MSDTYPLFSVIIPIYNVEKYLGQCVDSVINQSFTQAFEIILVDDGSPDGCPAMCDEYAINDKRIKVIHKINGGLSDARNVGMSIATGEYIVFLDADDYLTQTALLNIANTIMVSNQPDVVMLRFCKCDVENETLTGECSDQYNEQALIGMDSCDMYMHLAAKTMFTACTLVTKRSYLLENNCSFIKDILHEDAHWVPFIMLNAKTFSFCNDITYIWREGRLNSITTVTNIKRLFDIIWIIDDLLSYASRHKITNKQINVLRYSCCILFRYMMQNYNYYLKAPRIKELKQMIEERMSVLLFSKKIKYVLYYLSLKVFGLTNSEKFISLAKKFKRQNTNKTSAAKNHRKL